MNDAPSVGLQARANQPDDDYFDLMAEVARTHWWYRARRAVASDALAGRVPDGGRALDVGTGTGDNLGVLTAAGASAVAGTDLSHRALRHAASRPGHPPVLEALAEQLPFADASFVVLTSMDVIEHLDDDVLALREYVRVLRPGATVLLTVPAYQGLWGEHDVRAGHRRRYRAATLHRAATDAGIVVERVTYLFSFLVPPALLLRRTPLGRLVGGTDDEVSVSSRPVAAVMAALCRIERRVLRRGGRIPFGLSLLLVGHVPPDRP